MNHFEGTNEYRIATVRSGTTVGNSTATLSLNTTIQRSVFANRTNVINRVNGTQTHSLVDPDQDFTILAGYIIGNGAGPVRLNLALRELILTNINRAADLGSIENNQITAWSVSV